MCLSHTCFERWKCPLLESEFRANEPIHLVNEAMEILRKFYMGEMFIRKIRKMLALMVRVPESCLRRCYGVIQRLRV